MTTYVAYQDLSKTDVQLRLDNILAKFEAKRGYRPALVLVNDAQAGEITAPDGIEVEARHTVAADTFWLALREPALIGGEA